MEILNGKLFLDMTLCGAAHLAAQRKTINDLNVFPIPDGDTGDNMYMTIRQGCGAPASEGLGATARAISDGMLTGARGNSGVILSRIFAGIARGLEGAVTADITLFKKAMDCAVKEAYGAVAVPVEGTILTVLRESVEAASGCGSFEEYFESLASAMETSLDHTPELLDVLARAGVVDSGGAGLLCIAEGMKAGLHGETPDEAFLEPQEGKVQPVDLGAFTEDSVLKFGYCTEFLLRLQRSKVDLGSFDEKVLSDWLGAHGESLVFFRDGSIIKVHVHTRTPGEILNHCQLYGEFLTLKIENMTLQHHENHMDERFHTTSKKLGVVAVAAGERLQQTFREMGADQVVEGGQTMNPPVQAFLEAFSRIDAESILVFPNNGNIVLTARQAASMWDKARIEVIPTHSPGEGYYAMACLDTSEDIDTIVASLGEALEGTVSGMVSRAIRESEAGHTGDYLGISGKDILCSNPSRPEALLALANALDASQRDIAVLFQGAEVPAEEAEQARAALEKACLRTEITLIDGGQPVYDYILLLC
ncbi:MAG: DAK2 domain-containing protein [Bacteroidales bacterium]|nr:DAK2 domain-containing protein [Bacteroidales bacterium]